MNAILPGDWRPDAEMMGLSLCLTSLALAGTSEEARTRFAALHSASDGLRAGLAAIASDLAIIDRAIAAPDLSTIRALLDGMLDVERGLARLSGLLEEALTKPMLKALPDGSQAENPFRLLDEIRLDFLPAIRDIRLRTICEIAMRASHAGVDVIPVSDGFRAMFRLATIEDTEGWQETAFILADIETARSLTWSIASSSHDKTEDFTAIFAENELRR